MPMDMTNARALADRLAAILSAMPPPREDADTFSEGIVQLRRAILDEGGSIATGHVDRVSALGFTATSTAGLVQACGNWIAAVRSQAVAP